MPDSPGLWIDHDQAIWYVDDDLEARQLWNETTAEWTPARSDTRRADDLSQFAPFRKLTITDPGAEQ